MHHTPVQQVGDGVPVEVLGGERQRAAVIVGEVGGQGGGAASAFGGEEGEGLARAFGSAVAAPAAFTGALFERPAERDAKGGMHVLVDAGAKGGQDRIGVGDGVQGDDQGVARGGPDAGNQPLQRALATRDIQQDDVRPHALEAVEETAHVGGIRLLDGDAEGQLGETGARLLHQVLVLDSQSDG